MEYDRARSLMAKEQLDGVIATSYENVARLSGTAIMTQRLIPERLAAVVLPLSGDPSLIVCTVEQAQAERESHIHDIRGYTEFSNSPAQMIADAVRDRGLEHGRIGLEIKALSLYYYQELVELLPHATFAPADDLFDSIRMVKMPEEIEILAKAALATDAAIHTAYANSKIGASDKLIADTMASCIQANGADAVAFLVLGAGPNAALAHPYAQNRPLQEGDIVRCDVGGYFSGYFSDLARTAVVGTATAEQQQAYKNLWQVHELLIAAVQPGIPAKDLFHLCKREFNRHGLNLKAPHIGHSLGLGLHEYPLLNPFNETILEEDMVIAIEPIHVMSDGVIFHVEDLVRVTSEGSEVLSRSTDWSNLYVIDGR
jgi:Xaa-Pro dipeptidase